MNKQSPPYLADNSNNPRRVAADDRCGRANVSIGGGARTINECQHDWKFIFHMTAKISIRIDECRLCGCEKETRTRQRADGSFGVGRVTIRRRK